MNAIVRASLATLTWTLLVRSLKSQLFSASLRCLQIVRRVGQTILGPGRSPEWYRRVVRNHFSRLVYEPGANKVTVSQGPLIGLSKYGPFCERDVEFVAGVYEPALTAAMARCVKPGEIAMDIGANAGYHTLMLSKLAGENGRVFAFEPVPVTAHWLRETISQNDISNVTVVEAAIGASNERRQILYGEALDGFATLSGVGHGYYDGQGCLSTQVDVITADSWLEEHQVERLSFVKIDVEGAELAVLRGMQTTLHRLRPSVICEFWGAENIKEGHQFFGDHSYKLTTLEEWRGQVRGREVIIANVLALPEDLRR